VKHRKAPLQQASSGLLLAEIETAIHAHWNGLAAKPSGKSNLRQDSKVFIFISSRDHSITLETSTSTNSLTSLS
jgi:hypothetical protein